jgi:DNA-binding MarR family transcriptional regulator
MSLGNVDQLMSTLRDTIVGTVRRDGPDLSARQFSIFLICYLEDGPHTVRGLAQQLEISKPAISRSLDRLAELSLTKRGPDPRDRRSVLVRRTRPGALFLADLRRLLAAGQKARMPAIQAVETTTIHSIAI